MCVVSPHGEWIYTIGEDLNLYCFSTSIMNLEDAMQAGEQVGVGCILWMGCIVCVCAHTQYTEGIYT